MEGGLYLFSVKLGKVYGRGTVQEYLQSLTNGEEPHKLHTFSMERRTNAYFLPIWRITGIVPKLSPFKSVAEA